MEYNKRKFAKARDKKLLHKINKRWVVISVSLLAALGAKALTSHPVSANVTDSNANSSQKVNSNSKSSNVKLVNSNVSTNQNRSKSDLQGGPTIRSDSDSIIHKAHLLHQGIISNVLKSSNSGQNNSVAASDSHQSQSQSIQGASQATMQKPRQLGAAHDNLSATPQSDVGKITFQYYNQHHQIVGNPATITGKVGSLQFLGASDIAKQAPVPEGYHLKSYQTVSKTLYKITNQSLNFPIHVTGDHVDKVIPVYLHIQSDGQSDVAKIPNYRFQGNIGDTIVQPNEFLTNHAYQADFNNQQSDYHMDNSNGRDRDAVAKMANGHFVPSQIDFYYTRSNQQIPRGMAVVKAYYYDLKNYNPDKSVAWNNQNALVPHSVKPDLMLANRPFNYGPRQQNIPSGYYFVKNLSQVPQKSGSAGSVENYRVGVAKNSRLIYQIPSDNYRVVNQQTLAGFKQNDPVAHYIKPMDGYTESEPYTTQKGNQIATGIDNDQTYYVNLTSAVTGHIVYHDVSDNTDLSIPDNNVITGKEGMPINYKNYSVPSGYHLNPDNQVKNRNWRLMPNTDYTIDIDRNQGQITLNYVASSDQNNVLKTRTVTGPVGSKFNDGPYTNNDYINGLLNGYHFDHLVNSVNDYANNPQTLVVSVAKNQQPVPQSDASVELDYVDGNNNEVERRMTLSGEKGTQIPYDQYTSAAYIPQGYSYTGLGSHTNTFENGANDVILLSKNNSQSTPVTPQNATVEIDYVDQSDGSVKNREYSSGIIGTAVPYSNYVTLNYIPQGYTLVGLGDHVDTFGNGDHSVILVRKNVPNSQSQPSQSPSYVKQNVSVPVAKSQNVSKPSFKGHSRKGSIGVEYVDPDGHVIDRRNYNGKSGESFRLGDHHGLAGYRFRKILSGGNINKFNSHRQLVVAQMLPLTSLLKRNNHQASGSKIIHQSDVRKQNNGRLGAIKSYTPHNVNQSNYDASGLNKLPQTGERNSSLVKAMGAILLAISAILIASGEFDLKRRHD